MLRYFLDYVQEHQLIEEGEKTLLAVSGGIDSMVMADLFIRSGFKFAVSHVNFGLRGKESDRDELLVKEWCLIHKIDLYTQKVPEGLFERQESIQMVARDYRYRYFSDVMEKYSLQKLATAHHLDDSLETALFNFTKGTGLRGLRGIEVRKDSIIRPMLFAEKEQILDYAKTQNIRWREDASNKKNDYHRNKIRNQIIPVLKSINPGLSGTFRSVSERISDAQDLIDQTTDSVLQKYLREENGVLYISLDWMGEFQNPSTILREVLRPYGFSYLQIKQIDKVIREAIPGKVFYAEKWILNVDRQQLILKEKKAQDVLERIKLVIPGVTFLANHSIETLVIEGNRVKDFDDPAIAYLDCDKVIDAEISGWKEGDVFYPLGMKGKKKVSDFMIDSKIPVTLKRDIPILRSEDRIAWIVGHRIDDRYKVTPNTKRTLRLHFREDV